MVLANEVALEAVDARDLKQLRENAKEKIDKNQAERKARFDARRCNGRTFKEGDQVLVRTQIASNQGQSKKILPKYSGPYVITRVLDHDRYVIKDLRGSTSSQKKFEGVVSLDKLTVYNVQVSSESESDVENLEKTMYEVRSDVEADPYIAESDVGSGKIQI